MSRAKGINSILALGYETQYNHTPAVGYKMPFNQSRISIKQNLIDSATIRGGRRDQMQPTLGNIDVSGSVVAPIDQVGFGYWLRAMFGNPTTTAAGSIYTHVFHVTGSQPSLVLEQQYPDISVYEMYNGCKVNRFSFSYGGDKELIANIDILGAKRTISAASFDSTLADFSVLKFSNFQGAIEEGGSPTGKVTEASLNIDFGLDGNAYAIGGGGCRTDLPEGTLQVSGSIKAFFEDAALLNKAVNNTKSSLKFKFTSGANSLEFYMGEVVFQQISPGIETDKGIFINLPYKAFGESAITAGVAGSVITATLVNTVSAYA